MIAQLFAPLAAPGGLGLADDAATLTPSPGHDLVITKDALVAGVHFFADDPPASIARKALGVNLSDLAAKGAAPKGFFLAIGRSAGMSDAWLAGFAEGLGTAAREAECPLYGGDTVKAPDACFLSITAFGEVPFGKMVPRQGGNPGDVLFVSGTIGDAALGLQLRLNPEAPWVQALAPEHRATLIERYLHPRPRLALAPVLRAYASAAMDVSDGLVGDVDKLTARLGKRVDVASVPLSPAVQAALVLAPQLLDTALTGGDDYEILAAVPYEKALAFAESAGDAGIPVRRIGEVCAGATHWLAADGRDMAFQQRAYHHF